MFLTLILKQCGFVSDTYSRNGNNIYGDQFWKEENDFIITITAWHHTCFSLSLKSQDTLISAYTQAYNVFTRHDGTFKVSNSGPSNVYTRKFDNTEKDLVLNYTEIDSIVTTSLSNADIVWDIIHAKGLLTYFVWNIFTNQIKHERMSIV